MDRRGIGRACQARPRRRLHAGLPRQGGAAAPIRPGDRVAYYSPSEIFRGKDKLQAFTAIRFVRAGEPYQFDMGGFVPFRRDVDWLKAEEASIQPLLDVLDFTGGVRNWDYQLRFGLFSVSDHDLNRIAEAMKVTSARVRGPQHFRHAEVSSFPRMDTDGSRMDTDKVHVERIKCRGCIQSSIYPCPSVTHPCPSVENLKGLNTRGASQGWDYILVPYHPFA